MPSQDEDQARAPGPDGGVHRDAELLARLFDHNARLASLLVRMRTAVEQGEFRRLNEPLKEFYRVRAHHILDRNVRLMNQLAAPFLTDREATQWLLELRQLLTSEMHTTGELVERYGGYRVGTVNVDAFLEELDRTAASLQQLEVAMNDCLARLYKERNADHAGFAPLEGDD